MARPPPAPPPPPPPHTLTPLHSTHSLTHSLWLEQKLGIDISSGENTEKTYHIDLIFEYINTAIVLCSDLQNRLWWTRNHFILKPSSEQISHGMYSHVWGKNDTHTDTQKIWNENDC